MSDGLQQLRKKLDSWEVDGVLITSAGNRRWLSGFSGSAGRLLITRERALLATDFRYWEQAKEEAPAFTLFEHRRRDEDTKALLAEAGARRIGIEASHMSVADFEALKGVDGYEWKPLSHTAEGLRQVKSAAELATMRRAAEIGDHAMAQVPALARPGMSERALAWALERLVREMGADALAYPVIVASGANSALPHHHSGERELQAGDIVLIDLGAEVAGYKSDLTRTFYLGDEPDGRFWEVYNCVLAAQSKAIEQMRPGMNNKEIDSLARDVIVAAGYGEQFGHGLGHGVGLEIHEKPSLSPRSEKEKMPGGAVTTVEPGIYIPGWGGVRIEDLVLVGREGVSFLSHCPKNPLITLTSSAAAAA